MIHLEISRIYELYVSTSGVCTDTRKIEADCMFFALRGDTFNGNDFAFRALEQGAKYVVVDEEAVYARWESGRKNGEEFPETPAMLLVENVLETLQQMARFHRLKYKIPVIGLTGTNGKTTTKELITAALSAKFRVISTAGNLNNHIGVPLTLLNINEETQVAVIEMGASAPGEIEMLMNLTCPSFGLITNVGKAHLQGFGSFEGVKKTKGELYDNLAEHRKIAFVNVDNPHLWEMVQQRPALQIVPYGIKNDNAGIVKKPGSPYLNMVVHNPCAAAVCGRINIADNGMAYACCEPAEIEVNTHLIGDYNMDNVLAALCIATYFDVSALDAVQAVENYTPSNNRSQMTKTEKNTLIIDAYNANPTSMRVSLENFAGLDLPHKILILGDMLELGADSLDEHKEIIEQAVSIAPDFIYLVGGEFARAYANLHGLSYKHIELFPDSLQLQERLLATQPDSSTVLIKGSRGIRLERVFNAL